MAQGRAEREAQHDGTADGGRGRPQVTLRRVGLEEELLLADVDTGELRSVAGEVIAACAPAPGDRATAQVKHEFFLSQVEVASNPHTDLGEVRAELVQARERIAAVGGDWGVAPLAVPGPVLPPSPASWDVTPGVRYAEIDRHYGDVARQSLMCALHVHVEVADDEEGVAVIDRVRPWVPLLVAISANSPYWHGRDTGYQSWRARVWNLWPTGGPAELFRDARTYHAVVRDMVRRGAALDAALVNLDVRLSCRYPTVEFRVADVCTDIDDALVVAALARALVTHAVDSRQAPPDPWRVDELRAAAWRASRFGFDGTLVSPATRELAEAADVLKQLVALLAEPLDAAGDLALVTRGLTALRSRGSGAARQRAAFTQAGGMAGVVAELRSRTLRS
jgi:carboxylate-amine ligase